MIRIGNTRAPLYSSDVAPPPLGWRPIMPYCVTAGGGNTGRLGFRSLQLYNTETGAGMGVTKPNTSDQPEYVPPSQDLSACPVPGELEVSPQNLLIGSAEYLFDLTVTSDQDWTITSFSPGLSFNKLSGSGNETVGVVVSPNEDTFQVFKSFTIVTMGGTARTVQIEQAAFDPSFLGVVPSSLSFDALGGTQEIQVTTSQTWTFSDNISWAQVSRSGNILTVSVNQNNAGQRNGSVTITGDTATVSIPVSQEAVSLQPITFLGRGFEVGVFEGADNAWDAISNTTQYLGYSTHGILQPGSRLFRDPSATITIDGQSQWYRYLDVVFQLGPDGWINGVTPVDEVEEPGPGPDPDPTIGVRPPALLFPAAGGRENIQILAPNNLPWSASVDGVGVTLNDTAGTITGSGDSQVSVSVPQNIFDQILFFTITVSISGVVYTSEITQAPSDN